MPISNTTQSDPLTELFDVASALLFLECAIQAQQHMDTQSQTPGMAYLAGLMGHRVRSIATTLWDEEDSAPASRPQTSDNPRDR